MLITLYKIRGMLFRLLATNGFRVKTKKERFTAARSRCRQNLKYENFPSSFGRLRQNTAPKSELHVQHDYFSSFNQSNHWFVALSLTLPSSDLKLPVVSQRTTKNCTKMKDARAGRAQFADVTVVLIKYADLWCPRCRCHCASFLTGWCLSIYDSNATNQEFDWLSSEK